ERTTAGGHEQDWCFGADGVDGLEERLGLHDHSRPAAIWIVVDRTMTIVREVAQVVHVIIDRASFPCARWNAQSQRRCEKVREDRNDVDFQRGKREEERGKRATRDEGWGTPDFKLQSSVARRQSPIARRSLEQSSGRID